MLQLSISTIPELQESWHLLLHICSQYFGGGCNISSIKQVPNSQFNDWSLGRKRSARSIALAIPAKAKMIWEAYICKHGTEIESWITQWWQNIHVQNTTNTFVRNGTYQYTSGEREGCKHEKIMKNSPIFSNQIIQLISNYQPVKSEHTAWIKPITHQRTSNKVIQYCIIILFT